MRYQLFISIRVKRIVLTIRLSCSCSHGTDKGAILSYTSAPATSEEGTGRAIDDKALAASTAYPEGLLEVSAASWQEEMSWNILQ